MNQQIFYSLFFLLQAFFCAAQLRPCSAEDDFEPEGEFGFFPFPEQAQVEPEVFEDTLHFDKMPGFKILVAAYDEYYLAKKDSNGTERYYYLSFFASLHEEHQVLKDSILGDLLVLYGTDVNGRSSARYGDGWGTSVSTFTIIDPQRWGWYGEVNYRNSEEHWGTYYTDTSGKEIYYSDIQDTITNPNYEPSSHFNEHNRSDEIRDLCELTIAGRKIKLDCSYQSFERLDSRFLDGQNETLVEGDSCAYQLEYFRDQDGIFKTKDELNTK